MIEESFELHTEDGHIIYGLKNSNGQKTNKAVILAHGYPSSINIHLFQTAKRYFTSKGYDVIRFSFFEAKDKARNVMDITLETQVKDLKQVVQLFEEQYPFLCLIGHSYGGLTAAMANPKSVSAMSFWDPTFAPSIGSWVEYTEYKKELDVCFFEAPVRQVTGKKALDEAKEHDLNTSLNYASKIKCPAQVILAKVQPEKMDRSKLFYAIADNVPKELLTISGTTHGFVEGNKVFELLDASYEWFEKHKKNKKAA